MGTPIRTITNRTDLVRLPWTLRVDGASMTVRPGTPRDLANTAVMHHRCSARTLLGRYGLGGRSPSILAIDRQLRQPHSYLVTMRDAQGAPGRVVATATLGPDLKHGPDAANGAILVEDTWQNLGIGRELLTHVAGVAAVLGYRELVGYPGLMTEVIQRLVTGIGTTRQVNDEDGISLRTTLSLTAPGGVGALRAGALATNTDLFERRIG